MATIAHTDDSRPVLTPESTAVAGPPVAADSAISCTGLVSVDVKYSVMRDATCASTRPPTTAPNMRQPTFDELAGRVADVDEREHERADDREDAGGEEAAVDRRHRGLVLLGGAHREHADDRREHAERAGAEREQRAGRPQLGLVREDRRNAGTPRMIDATSVTSYDSNRSAAIPAQSPTLSPTLSAIVAGLRGSSSGMPASTLPTRSAPTSAALVKMPPPTRRNSASSEPPNPKPIEDRRARVLEDHDDHGRAEQTEADGEHAGDAAGAERDLERLRHRAATSRPPRCARCRAPRGSCR